MLGTGLKWGYVVFVNRIDVGCRLPGTGDRNKGWHLACLDSVVDSEVPMVMCVKAYCHLGLKRGCYLEVGMCIIQLCRGGFIGFHNRYKHPCNLHRMQLGLTWSVLQLPLSELTPTTVTLGLATVCLPFYGYLSKCSGWSGEVVGLNS